MKLAKTTYILFADIEEWRLVCDCPCPSAVEYPTLLLRLSGTTSELFADFTEPLPLVLSLLYGAPQPDAESLSGWRLGLIENLDEYGIPMTLEGVLPLPETIWADLKENLFPAATEPGYAVQVRLETREFLEKPSELDPERNFAVIAFGFELHFTRVNQ